MATTRRCAGRNGSRIRTHRGRVRPDMAPGCPERVDAAFLWWVLCKGRSAAVRRRNREALAPYTGKVVRLSSQRAIDRFLAEFPASLHTISSPPAR